MNGYGCEMKSVTENCIICTVYEISCNGMGQKGFKTTKRVETTTKTHPNGICSADELQNVVSERVQIVSKL